MAKTSDSYASLIKGVSEQTAHDRLPGQHWDQENMISDPVRGLSRRHGSIRMDEVEMPITIDKNVLDDLASRLEHTLYISGKEYGMFYRDGSVPASPAPPLLLVDKDARKLRQVVLTPAAQAIAAEGVGAICSAGRFLLMSGAKRLTTYNVEDNFKPTESQHCIWIRGGAYSRTFTVTVTNNNNGSVKTYEYTTMKSYYDVPLDTSDIPWNKPDKPDEPDPAYTSKVNNRTNAYNSAVNKHIADAAKDITPENICRQLRDKMRVDYPGTFMVGARGPYIVIRIDGVTVSVDDGGNGDFARAASREVTSPEMLTPQHWVGKVMIVQPKTAGAVPYYMKAEASQPNVSAGTFAEVTWKETAGEVVTPTFMFLIGEIIADILYVGESPAALKGLTGKDVPPLEPSRCGDTKSREVPDVFGRTITYMQMFQDRLMMIAGSTCFMSMTGDYFNFFGDSMLTVKPDDPIEVFAQGTEDDTITSGVQVDRNVVLFGKRYQYIVPGKDAMTPQNAFIGIAATYEGANLASPAVGGSLLFFCQRRESRLTMQQMAPGSVADRLEAFDVSAQLDGYLRGTPQQIVAQTSPSAVFIKTREDTNGFYVYSYLDSGDQTQRLFDSWSHWSFSKQLGQLVGITADDGGLLAITARAGKQGNLLVLDRFTRESDISDYPYLDSLRPGILSTLVDDDAYAAYAKGSARRLIGTDLRNAAAMDAKYANQNKYLYSGTGYDSLVTLTSPYLRDQDDAVILDAKLTITKLTVAVARSAAMLAELSVDEGVTWKVAKDWLARETGTWQLNTQYIEPTASISVPVMKDNKTYRMRLHSRNWLPLTVSVVEWAGQAFTSRR